MNINKILTSLVLGLFISGITAGTALAWPWRLGTDSEEDKLATEATASIGYRYVNEDDETGRALEYDSLESGPTVNATLFTNQGPHYIHLELDYKGQDDFSSELEFDTKNMFLIQLRSERFYHNLDHIPYDNGFSDINNGMDPDPIPLPHPIVAVDRYPDGTPVAGSRPDGSYLDTNMDEHLRVFYSDDDPGEEYGLRLGINEAKLKIKYPGYPAHFNISYWRYEKLGDKQLRFVGENCATACHMQSKTRRIDRVTEEFKAGIDAHVGFVDLVVEGLHRMFRDNEPIPRDYFGSHDRGRDLSQADPMGRFEHSEDPDSTLSELTLKANTAPSGGLAGSASFTLGERKNRTDLTSVGPVKAKTEYYKTTADVTYTPGRKWTFNLRYRLLDMDSDNTDVFADYDNVYHDADVSDYPINVRNAMDIKRAWYEAIVNYRPTNRLTLKGELRREDIDRSDTGPDNYHHSSGDSAVANEEASDWKLPDRETITRAKVGFSARLLDKSALKVHGWAALQQSDDPAYGTSFETSRELFLNANYTPSPLWGLIANANLLQQENDEFELEDRSIDRKKLQQNLSVGTWLNPRQGLSFDLNYGYFHTAIEQDLQFGTGEGYIIPNDDDAYPLADFPTTDYEQSVHTVTLGMNWQAAKNLSCRLETYYIRSRAHYDPEFFAEMPFTYYGVYMGYASSSDLREISEVDIRQKGLRGRLNWQINEEWSGGFEATVDDYDERNSNIYDGSVQTTMVSLSRRW